MEELALGGKKAPPTTEAEEEGTAPGVEELPIKVVVVVMLLPLPLSLVVRFIATDPLFPVAVVVTEDAAATEAAVAAATVAEG